VANVRLTELLRVTGLSQKALANQVISSMSWLPFADWSDITRTLLSPACAAGEWSPGIRARS